MAQSRFLVQCLRKLPWISADHQPKEKAVAAKPSQTADLLEGARVRLCGLTSKVGILQNGKFGVVETSDGSSGRLVVRCDDGSVGKYRPFNLAAIAAPYKKSANTDANDANADADVDADAAGGPDWRRLLDTDTTGGRIDRTKLSPAWVKDAMDLPFANKDSIRQGGSAFAGTAVGDRLAMAEAMRAEFVGGEEGAVRRFNTSEQSFRLGLVAGMEATFSVMVTAGQAGSPEAASRVIDGFLRSTADECMSSSAANATIEKARGEELCAKLEESRASLKQTVSEYWETEPKDIAPRAPQRFDQFVEFMSHCGLFPFAPAAIAKAIPSDNSTDNAECNMCNQNVDPADKFVHECCGQSFHHSCMK